MAFAAPCEEEEGDGGGGGGGGWHHRRHSSAERSLFLSPCDKGRENRQRRNGNSFGFDGPSGATRPTNDVTKRGGTRQDLFI